MEYLYYYLILAISFSIMYCINYVRDIIWSIETMCDMFDIDMSHYFSIYWYYFASFTVVSAIFPFFLWIILTMEKYEIIEHAVKSILKEHFDYDNEN